MAAAGSSLLWPTAGIQQQPPPRPSPSRPPPRRQRGATLPGPSPSGRRLALRPGRGPTHNGRARRRWWWRPRDGGPSTAAAGTWGEHEPFARGEWSGGRWGCSGRRGSGSRGRPRAVPAAAVHYPRDPALHPARVGSVRDGAGALGGGAGRTAGTSLGSVCGTAAAAGFPTGGWGRDSPQLELEALGGREKPTCAARGGDGPGDGSSSSPPPPFPQKLVTQPSLAARCGLPSGSHFGF